MSQNTFAGPLASDRFRHAVNPKQNDSDGFDTLRCRPRRHQVNKKTFSYKNGLDDVYAVMATVAAALPHLA